MNKITLSSAIAIIGFTFSTPSWAQEDCILSKTGDVICGEAAEAERQRHREQQLERLKSQGPNNSVLVSNVGSQSDQARPTQSRSTEDAPIQKPTKKKKKAKSRSVYGNFGQQVSLRGGYVFDSNRDGVDGSPSAGVFAASYIKPIRRFGNHIISAEGEIVYYRDSDSVTIIGADVVSKIWSVSGLVGARYQYATGWNIDPFASFGIGPAYWKESLESGGVQNTNSALVFGYGGRAGLVASISDTLAIEGGYRFLGSTFGSSSIIQAAEVGVNWSF